MIINHNLSALNAWRALSINNANTQKALEKLSSGYRINRAGDDAAGLAISEKMRAQIRGLEMASKNAQDAISLIQTAEGALNETHSILQRMRELAVQSANDTNTAEDREQIQKEIDQLAQELSRIAKTTEFNTQKLLDGTFQGIFHIGANENQNISLNINNMGSAALGVISSSVKIGNESYTPSSGSNFLDAGVYTYDASNGVLKDSLGNVVANVTVDTTNNTVTITDANDSNKTFTIGASLSNGDTITVGGIDVSSQTAANTAIKTIQDAINTVSTERSKLGAYQNRLEHTINNLGVATENLTAAESRIRDVDMAKAMMEFTKNNILQQAATAMLERMAA
jgi:flagellin